MPELSLWETLTRWTKHYTKSLYVLALHGFHHGFLPRELMPDVGTTYSLRLRALQCQQNSSLFPLGFSRNPDSTESDWPNLNDLLIFDLKTLDRRGKWSAPMGQAWDSISIYRQGLGLALPNPQALRGIAGVLKELWKWWESMVGTPNQHLPPFFMSHCLVSFLLFPPFQDLWCSQLFCLSPSIHIILLSLDAFSHQFLFCKLLLLPQDPNITFLWSFLFGCPYKANATLFSTHTAFCAINQELNSLARIRS